MCGFNNQREDEKRRERTDFFLVEILEVLPIHADVWSGQLESPVNELRAGSQTVRVG